MIAHKQKFFLLSIWGLLVLSFGCSKAILDEGDVEPITSATYVDDVAPIISANCLNCHSGPTPFAGLRLVDYDDVRIAVENRNLIARINDTVNPMPQSGLMPLQQRLTIERWRDDGFPEN